MSENTEKSTNDPETSIKPQPIGGPPIPKSFLNYHSSVYSHMTNRLPWQDIIARQIYLSGAEGIDRMTISATLGINGNTKYGNRKVSNYIHLLSKGLPYETGAYQKLVGKSRVLNFYHKSFEPQAYSGCINEISKLLGRECPFKIGDSINFPEKKLTNMRITDVTVRRLKVIIEALNSKPAYPLRELISFITESDTKKGFDGMVDRRTMQKYAYALERYDIGKVHLCRVLEDDTNIESELVILSKSEIESSDDPAILQAIAEMKKAYNDQGRSFPHGQMKKFTINHQTIPKPEKPSYAFELHVPDEPKKSNKEKQKEFLQRKMIRAHLLHSLIFRVVYHPDSEKGITYYDLFPNETEPEPREFNEMRVFDDKKDSFFRFVPPIKPHEGLDRGWFTLRMILRVMPLSMYVLCFNVEVDDVLMEYLSDPIKRHILLSDLPSELRVKFINKKVWSYVDAGCTMLCGMGLLNASPDSRRVTGPIAMYYCKKKWHLYDTSTVQKAYSIIIENPSELEKYDYEFRTLDDVERYWFHFRAIALSTPLNARSEKGEKSETSQKDGCRKEEYSVPSFNDINWISSSLPGKGACLTDAVLFSHLKRHWDMITVENSFIVWFSSKYIDTGNIYRKYAEDNVKNLNLRWLSTMQCMAPPAVIFDKKKAEKRRIKFEISDDEEEMNNNSTMDDSMTDDILEESEFRRIKAPKGKRRLDEEDIESVNRLQSLRYRFTNRERDTFILLRAVSQFLNPIGKMWVDPRVVRRIMKAYFEESNDKTVNAMTGASVRELGHRRDDVWHLVRGLGSFKKMKEIRDKLATVLNEDFEKKEEYFCQAFDIAYRLVTRDIPNLPSVYVNDETFNETLNMSNLTIGVTECPLDNPIVEKLIKMPNNENELMDNLMHDWIINNVLHEWLNVHTPLALSITAYKGSSIFHSYIEKLHDEGILCKSKLQSIGFRSRISPSSAFIGYFSHNIRNDVFTSISSLPNDFDQNIDDNFGAFLRICNSLKDFNSKFTVNIGMDTFACWQDFEIRRNLRDTESGALNLNHVVTSVESESLGKLSVNIPEKFSEIQIAPLVENMDRIESDEYIINVLNKLDKNNKKVSQEIIKKLKEAEVNGLPIEDIKNYCEEKNMNEQDINDLLDILEESVLIFKCGFDVPRYIISKYIRNWTLPVQEKLLFMKPWTMPDGSINLTIFRWFTEMLFVTIHESPYIDIEHLKSYFCGAIHAALVEEMLEFLVDNQVLEKIVEDLEVTEVKGPFKKVTKTEKKIYYKSGYRGFERFTLLFEGINLPEYNYSDIKKSFTT